YIVSVDSLNSPDGIFHLAITGGNHLHQRGLMHAFQPSHLDYVGFYVNFSGGPATIGGYFVVLPSGGLVVPSMVFFIFWDDASMRIYDNNSYTTYPFIGGQWYHVEFKNIDWIAQTLDWYVDNTLVIADHPFRASSTLGGVAEVQLYNWDLSTAMYDQVILSGNPTGMPDKNKPFRIDVFPNPAGRDLFIETAGMRHAFFSLQDITGKALLSCEKKEVRTHLDLSDLPQGVYLLKITDSDRGYTETRKVIIQR
ncbi:MAG: T9SS type A sorting domain-containing protein, partial [Flavobacteriales bacterium]